MRLSRSGLLAGMLATAAACGYTDPGQGSETLEVRANADYTAEDRVMDVVATVLKSGAPVQGAQVVVADGEDEKTWTLAESDQGCPDQAPSCYRASLEGYHRRLELRVRSGADKLTARLEGPGPHIIINPKHQDVLKRAELGSELLVEWEVKDGIAAEDVQVRLERGDASNTVRQDKGEYEIRSSSLATGEEGVFVERRMSVALAGGTDRSTFTISYEAHNSFTVE